MVMRFVCAPVFAVALVLSNPVAWAQSPAPPGAAPTGPCAEGAQIQSELQKAAASIEAAKKAKSGTDACQALKRYTVGMAKLVKFAEVNGFFCGVSPETTKGMKTAQAQAGKAR